MSKEIRHIVHLSSADIWRGAEQQIIYLYQGLKTAGYTQTIFCSQDSLLARYCSEHQISYKPYYRESGINRNLVKALKSYHHQLPIDYIHIHDPHAHHAYIAAYLTGLKVPAVLHRRVDFPTAQNIFSAWKYQIKGIQKIICVSERVKQVFKSKPKVYNKAEVIYDCIDIQAYQKINGRNMLERNFPQLKDKFIVANIAALVDHKDHPTFIKAAHHLVKALLITNIHFLIIGQGEKEQEIKQMIQDYHLQDHITMTGHRKDIPEILNGIDLYTFTSKMEGFGSTILEVMAARVPIVATNTGGPAEILTHDKDALIAPVGDYIRIAHQIDILKSHPEQRKRITDQAIYTVKEFSISSYTERIEKIYEDFIIRSHGKSK